MVFRTSRATRTDALPDKRCLLRIEKIETIGAKPEQVTRKERKRRNYIGGREEERNRAVQLEKSVLFHGERDGVEDDEPGDSADDEHDDGEPIARNAHATMTGAAMTKMRKGGRRRWRRAGRAGRKMTKER